MVAIAGPTGSGKSELSLCIAQEFDGEVVNCDSLQIYRHFNIGTAKLPQEERRGIPHYLLDTLRPDEISTAGEYARRARAVLTGISGRGRLPVVVGGTGFYLRALLEGLFPGPARDDALRERLAARERRRPGSLHRILRRVDRAAAARIHSNDTPKLIRALEVAILTRRPLSENFGRGRDAIEGFRVLKFGLAPPRAALYQRLDRRLELMFTSGLIDEVRGILAMGYPPTSKPFESHGYKQALEYLSGELALEEAISSAQRNTRRYAKRQFTWFRREAGMEWLSGFGEDAAVQQDAINRVRKFLAG
jgi:tRNA dimethylallyltransferase